MRARAVAMTEPGRAHLDKARTYGVLKQPLAQAHPDLHGRSASPPASDARAEHPSRLRRPSHFRHQVFTEHGALAGVGDISEIVRGSFCSGYLGYYALVPHDGRGYMKRGISAVLSDAFGRHRLHCPKANIQPENTGSKALVLGLSTLRHAPALASTKTSGPHGRRLVCKGIARGRPAAHPSQVVDSAAKR